MKKIKNIYKEYYNNIYPSSDIDKKIFNKTIYQKSNNLILKKCYKFIILIISISIIGSGIVFANEIKETIQFIFKTEKISNNNHRDLFISSFKVKNLKEINYNADLNEIDYGSNTQNTMSKKEIEKLLEIKFLDSNKLINNKVTIQRIEKVENKIASGIFVIRDAFKIEKEKLKKSYVTMSFQFNTKFSKIYEDGFNIFGSGTPFAIDNFITSKYIENLSTDVYFVSSQQNLKNNDQAIFIEAIFVYDDIGYHLSGSNISIDDLVDILKSLQ